MFPNINLLHNILYLNIIILNLGKFYHLYAWSSYSSRKLSLAKELGRSVITFLSKLLDIIWRNSHDWIILDIWALVSFISIDILLTKALLILFSSLSCW